MCITSIGFIFKEIAELVPSVSTNKKSVWLGKGGRQDGGGNKYLLYISSVYTRQHGFEKVYVVKVRIKYLPYNLYWLHF